MYVNIGVFYTCYKFNNLHFCTRPTFLKLLSVTKKHAGNGFVNK